MLQLHELCRDLGRIDPPEAADLEVGRVDHDSRQVDNTSLFMALSGRQTNGLEYVEQALARGAVAIGLEKGVRDQVLRPQLSGLMRLVATWQPCPLA